MFRAFCLQSYVTPGSPEFSVPLHCSWNPASIKKAPDKHLWPRHCPKDRCYRWIQTLKSSESGKGDRWGSVTIPSRHPCSLFLYPDQPHCVPQCSVLHGSPAVVESRRRKSTWPELLSLKSQGRLGGAVH